MTRPDDPNDTEPDSLYERVSGETPAEAVVMAVAEVTGRSPLAMEPLGEVIDPDALNRLFDGRADGPSSAIVAFDYCDQEVTVTADFVQTTRSDAAER